MHEGLLRLVVWRLTSLNNGERPKYLTLDIDGVRVRIDAGFAGNDTLEALEERNIDQGRLCGHPGLQKLAAPYLSRPRGRPPEQPREWCHDLEYPAGSWPTPRRVVLVVQERPDDLLLHAFFLVTNLGKFDWPPVKVVSAKPLLAGWQAKGTA